jgi:ABC-type polar amino acid transport system ATPase subunit
MNTVANTINGPDAARSSIDNLALSLSGVVRRFSSGRGIGPVCLHVAWKRILSLIGPNAAGKTTILRCIAGFERLDQGTIEVAGRTVSASPPEGWGGPTGHEVHFDHLLGSTVGIVFQNAEPWPHLRVIDNILLPLVHGLSLRREEALARAEMELERFGLSDRARSMPHQLSGGVRQRVVLARALALRSQILLLDEVTSALDPEWTERVRQILLEFGAAGGAVISVSHRLNLVRRMSDWVIYLNDGHVIEEGPPRCVLDFPKDPGLQRFLENA